MRDNGWDRPYDLLQIGTWLLLPILVAGFYGFQLPLLPLAWQIITGAVYGIFLGSTVILAAKCTATNPADPACLRRASRRSLNHRESSSSVSSDIFCHACMTYVEKRSKHCRICDKCVLVFDHHCKWLNNCIGSKNYKFFLGTVGSVFLLSIVHVAVVIYLLVWLYTSPGVAAEKVSEVYPWTSLDPSRGVVIAYTVVLFPVVLLLLQLGGFHCVLTWKGMTTYDYIVSERKRLTSLARQRSDHANRGSFWRPSKQPGKKISAAAAEESNSRSSSSAEESKKAQSPGPAGKSTQSPPASRSDPSANTVTESDAGYSSIRSPGIQLSSVNLSNEEENSPAGNV